MIERLEIRVSGRVQGVAFRWHSQQQAEALGLGGTVRNEPDGSVHIVAEGSRESLEALLVWARSGPPHARVTDCETRWLSAQNDFGVFRITG